MAAKPYDPTLKALVDTGAADWPVFLGYPAAPTDVLDADVATVAGAADKVLHVRAAPPYLLHLEFQAGHDSARLPRLLHLRNVLLEERHDLPVRSVAVLLRPAADSPALTGTRSRAFAGEEPYVVFRYRVVRIWQVPAAPLLAGGLGTLPLAPIGAVTEADLPGIIEEMKQRLSQRRARPWADRLWAATYILLGLRYSQQLAHQLLRGVVSMKESVTYQAIIEEGEAKGAVAEARRMLLLQGESVFGPPNARTLAALERIGDVRRLEELGVRLLNVDSWQELLGRPAPRRRGRGSS